MKLLVIEDDRKISAFLKAGLEAECFAVDTAYDGEKGLFLAKTNDYDLIILDLILPKLNGQEVCQEIRKKSDTPIIILSGKNEVQSKINLLNSGADDYINKPFSFSELFSRIKSILRRPKKIKKDVIKIRNLVLDSGKHTLEKNGKEIHLTKKEFMLLEFLMKNQGQVLTRGIIMEHVWDINADPFSNTIETHIRSLRKKIDSGKQKIIKTIPGIGYKIEC